MYPDSSNPPSVEPTGFWEALSESSYSGLSNADERVASSSSLFLQYLVAANTITTTAITITTTAIISNILLPPEDSLPCDDADTATGDNVVGCDDVGVAVGVAVGGIVGAFVGNAVGRSVGMAVVGKYVGKLVGWLVGMALVGADVVHCVLLTLVTNPN